jgi:hypothetical protein
VTDSGATDIGLYGATIKGSFADATGTDCQVRFFVDTADRGTANPALWAKSFTLENQNPGSFSRSVTGLDFNSTYRYRIAVANAGGSLKWTSAAGTFQTLLSLGAPTLGDSQCDQYRFLTRLPPRLHRHPERNGQRHRRGKSLGLFCMG